MMYYRLYIWCVDVFLAVTATPSRHSRIHSLKSQVTESVSLLSAQSISE